MTALFRTVYLVAAALSITAGALVIASFFIADRAPQSRWYIAVHLVIAGVFLALGLLLNGIQRHAAAIALLAERSKDAAATHLRHHLHRLFAYLLVGGLVLTAILGTLTYAIVTRIDQGYAVFG